MSIENNHLKELFKDEKLIELFNKYNNEKSFESRIVQLIRLKSIDITKDSWLSNLTNLLYEREIINPFTLKPFNEEEIFNFMNVKMSTFVEDFCNKNFTYYRSILKEITNVTEKEIKIDETSSNKKVENNNLGNNKPNEVIKKRKIKNFKNKKQNSKTKMICNVIKNSNIDYSLGGWENKLKKEIKDKLNIDLSPTNIWNYITTYFPEKYCRKKKEEETNLKEKIALIELNTEHIYECGDLEMLDLTDGVTKSVVDLLCVCGIDFSKRGWSRKLTTIFGIPAYNSCYNVVKNNFPNFVKKYCYSTKNKNIINEFTDDKKDTSIKERLKKEKFIDEYLSIYIEWIQEDLVVDYSKED
jgi:hypothetical protein